MMDIYIIRYIIVIRQKNLREAYIFHCLERIIVFIGTEFRTVHRLITATQLYISLGYDAPVLSYISEQE